MSKYCVWLKSVPGMYEQYSGKITVFANSEDIAIDRVFQKLRGSFPERSRSMWKIEKIERLYV